MKLLWVKTDFLHPTTKGGHIRTLETLKRIHARHEVHYAAFTESLQAEGPTRAKEYAAKVFPVEFHVPPHYSPKFALQLLQGLVDPLPVAISRYVTPAMKRQLAEIIAREKYTCIVCDFLAPAPNFADLSQCVIFQHNVEAAIWRRHVEHAGNPLKKAYFQMQADRMAAYEKKACLEAKHVIAVSEKDAQTMKQDYGVRQVTPVPTGVDVDFFRPPTNRAANPEAAELVFVGSMDWLPNVDGMEWFAAEILAKLLAKRPNLKVAVVGRSPNKRVLELAAAHPQIQVTGTVPDVRPYLWDAKVSIVPLRIGGGTRLKIYEAMAAKVPVVSTAVGAEGLDAVPGEEIILADAPEDFAAQCLALLDAPERRQSITTAALHLVETQFGWDKIARQFEEILLAHGQLR